MRQSAVWIALIMTMTFQLTKCPSMEFAQYQYSDGNGNSYKIGFLHEKSFEYVPVKPEQSSSGEYDGGKPVSKSITDDDLQKIVAAFNLAFNNSSIHIQNRIKGTGLIIKKQARKETVVVIRGDSVEKENIEKILKKLLK